MQVKHLDHVNLTVRSFDETVDWYRRIFGFEIVEEEVEDGVRWGVIRSGDAMLCIYEHPGREFLTGSGSGTATSTASRTSRCASAMRTNGSRSRPARTSRSSTAGR